MLNREKSYSVVAVLCLFPDLGGPDLRAPLPDSWPLPRAVAAYVGFGLGSLDWSVSGVVWTGWSSRSMVSFGILVYFFSSLSLVYRQISPFRQSTLVRRSPLSFLHLDAIFSSSLLSFIRSDGMASWTLTLALFFPFVARALYKAIL